jgi:hypothetical protein
VLLSHSSALSIHLHPNLLPNTADDLTHANTAEYTQRSPGWHMWVQSPMIIHIQMDPQKLIVFCQLCTAYVLNRLTSEESTRLHAAARMRSCA